MHLTGGDRCMLVLHLLTPVTCGEMKLSRQVTGRGNAYLTCKAGFDVEPFSFFQAVGLLKMGCNATVERCCCALILHHALPSVFDAVKRYTLAALNFANG